MANITIKNLPGELHKHLKANAERNHRSLNGEIISSLERALSHRGEMALDVFRDRARKIHKELSGKVWVTEKELKRMKSQGRS